MCRGSGHCTHAFASNRQPDPRTRSRRRHRQIVVNADGLEDGSQTVIAVLPQWADVQGEVNFAADADGDGIKHGVSLRVLAVCVCHGRDPCKIHDPELFTTDPRINPGLAKNLFCDDRTTGPTRQGCTKGFASLGERCINNREEFTTVNIGYRLGVTHDSNQATVDVGCRPEDGSAHGANACHLTVPIRFHTGNAVHLRSGLCREAISHFELHHNQDPLDRGEGLE